MVSIVHSLVVMNLTPGRAWMTDFYMVLRNRLVCGGEGCVCLCMGVRVCACVCGRVSGFLCVCFSAYVFSYQCLWRVMGPGRRALIVCTCGCA
jgi:hypothetical protein